MISKGILAGYCAENLRDLVSSPSFPGVGWGCEKVEVGKKEEGGESRAQE